jgi:hypothetical protein
VELIFTIASRLLRICGSGTSRTSIFWGAIQHVAFILESSVIGNQLSVTVTGSSALAANR